ncbi:hypothetical protein HerbRD11066_67250 [Herbidospora sp. RD11066]
MAGPALRRRRFGLEGGPVPAIAITSEIHGLAITRDNQTRTEEKAPWGRVRGQASDLRKRPTPLAWGYVDRGG